MKINLGDSIAGIVVEKLMLALDGAARAGDVSGTLALAGYLIKLRKKIGNQTIQVLTEYEKQEQENPPDGG